MVDKSTSELDNILGSTHIGGISKFLNENKESLIEGEKYFSSFMKDIMKKNGLLQQEVFLNADIPERYGYKLISEEKHTKQRDIILRLCYAAGCTLEETQKALKIYEMPQLYSRIPRDAMLMVCFNERPGTVLDVNTFLKKNRFEPLRSSGIQE
ncbi:MAG: hypothetical protein MJ107_04750 [Lachnospiraceae bacterium]|nr:hypothetical protein [Lachnospiraceae bacterium]